MVRMTSTGRHESATRSVPGVGVADPLQGEADPLCAILAPALSPAAPERGGGVKKTSGVARPVLVSAVVFALAFFAATHPDLFDRPVAVFINRLVGRFDLFDRVVSVVYWYPT